MNPIESTDTLKQVILWALGPGAGAIAQGVLLYIVSDREEAGVVIAPRTKRYLAFGLAILVPTVLYLVGVLLGFWGYDLSTNIVDVLAAFGTSQLLHTPRLATGEQMIQAGVNTPTRL